MVQKEKSVGLLDQRVNNGLHRESRFHPREWSALAPPALGRASVRINRGAARSRKKDGGGERPSKRIFISGVIYTRHFRIRRTEFDASALRFKRGPRCPVYNSKAEFIDWRGR